MKFATTGILTCIAPAMAAISSDFFINAHKTQSNQLYADSLYSPFHNHAIAVDRNFALSIIPSEKAPIIYTCTEKNSRDTHIVDKTNRFLTLDNNLKFFFCYDSPRTFQVVTLENIPTLQFKGNVVFFAYEKRDGNGYDVYLDGKETTRKGYSLSIILKNDYWKDIKS